MVAMARRRGLAETSTAVAQQAMTMARVRGRGKPSVAALEVIWLGLWRPTRASAITWLGRVFVVSRSVGARINGIHPL